MVCSMCAVSPHVVVVADVRTMMMAMVLTNIIVDVVVDAVRRTMHVDVDSSIETCPNDEIAICKWNELIEPLDLIEFCCRWR